MIDGVTPSKRDAVQLMCACTVVCAPACTCGGSAAPGSASHVQPVRNATLEMWKGVHLGCTSPLRSWEHVPHGFGSVQHGSPLATG